VLDLLADFGTNDPTLALAKAAMGCPYQWDPESHSLYAFSAHDVNRVMTSRDFWSEQGPDHRIVGLAENDRRSWANLSDFFSLWPVFSDGNHHKRMRRATRRLLRSALTPELLGSCERLATHRLATAADGTFDWIDHVARPLAIEALRNLLGGPDADELIYLSRSIMEELAAPRIEAARVDDALEALDELRCWLRKALVSPASPFLAEIADVSRDEDLGLESALALLTQIVTGAYDPILTSLGYVGERVTGELLTALPSQVVREEVFRLATPFRFASRYARHPVTIGHHHFGPGDRIVLCLGTANLDPSRYPEPLEFRQRKESSLSLSFGAGLHYCPGAPLARAIVTLLLNSLVTSGVHFDVARVEREPQLPMLRYRRLAGQLTPSTGLAASPDPRPLVPGKNHTDE
jgi:cytochrome P450